MFFCLVGRQQLSGSMDVLAQDSSQKRKVHFYNYTHIHVHVYMYIFVHVHV